MKRIKQLIKEVLDNFIEEGLIKTHQAKISVDRLNDSYKNNLIARLNKEDETIIDVFIKKYDKDILNKIIVTINSLGYIISKYSIEGFQSIYNDISFLKKINFLKELTPIYLKLEPKFDFESNNLSSKLFHVTHDRHIEKIKKIGLVPKSKSKKSYHPERIYLANNKESAKKLAIEFSKFEYAFEPNYILLEIDINKIPNIKLHFDPNFKNYGYFTYENIPPNAINFENTEFITIK